MTVTVYLFPELIDRWVQPNGSVRKLFVPIDQYPLLNFERAAHLLACETWGALRVWKIERVG